MPEIGFNKESLRSCGLSGLVEYLDYIMLYPDLSVDEITKRQICYWTHDKIFASEITSGDGNEDLYSTFSIEEAKSLASLDIDKLEGESELREKHGSYSGNIVSYIWKLDKNGLSGSVSKSIYLIKTLNGVSESLLRKSWSKYNSVAHFYAAKQIRDYIFTHDSVTGDISTEEFVRILSKESSELFKRNSIFILLSMYFYKFSTLRIESRTKKPLLDPENAWIFSEDLLPIKGGFDRFSNIVDATKWPLTDSELDALEAYRANEY